MEYLAALLSFLVFLRPAIAQSEGDVRLVDGVRSSEGRVEIYYNYEWGTICDDHWDLNDAAVVCRQLGYLRTIGAPGSAYFGQGYSYQPIHLDEVACTGSEAKLSYCSSRGWGNENCGHSEDAGVVCTNAAEADGDVRLVGGNRYEEGRVEIYYNSVWGTVCDDYWGYNEAKVVCNQLGFPGVSWSENYYGGGSGPIHLDDVVCSGYESSLMYCDHSPWGYHSCSHYEDVGVRCSSSSGSHGMQAWLISVIVISSVSVSILLIAGIAKACCSSSKRSNQTTVSYTNDPTAAATTLSTENGVQLHPVQVATPNITAPPAYDMVAGMPVNQQYGAAAPPLAGYQMYPPPAANPAYPHYPQPQADPQAQSTVEHIKY